MVDTRRRRSLLAVLVLVALVLVTVDYRQGEEGPLASVQRSAMSLFAPVQDGVAGAVRPVGDFFAGIGELGGLRQQNLALEAELEAIRQHNVSIADLARENAQLRELVGMRERMEFTTSAARVVAQPPGSFRWSVLIDIGEDQGARPNMAVVNADGLVGKITHTTGSYARVQLAISPNAGYSVRIADTGQLGLLSGRGTRPMQLRVIDDPEADIEHGAEVVTRAFQGTAIPDGVPVGTIEGGIAGADVAQFLAVTPHVDFSRLDIVLVVLDAPQVPLDIDPDQPAEEDGGLDDPDEEELDESGEPVADGEPTARAVADRPRAL